MSLAEQDSIIEAWVESGLVATTELANANIISMREAIAKQLPSKT